MATPKIKLYKLPPGYSSANDNDIQVATNDQLLPVKLKNVMPNQAYTLLGVSNKKNQVLIPVIHIDGNVDCSVTNTTNGLLKLDVSSTAIYDYSIPTEFNDSSTMVKHSIDKFLICDKSQMSPKFFKLQLNQTDNTYYRSYYEYGVDYKYVQDSNEQLSSDQNLKFVFSYNNTVDKFVINVLSPSDINGDLYVCNLFKYCLNECVATFHCVNKNTVYNLLKSDCNQDVLFTNENSQKYDNLFTTDYLPNQFMPFYHSNMSQQLKPKIMYLYQQETSCRVLDQEHGNFNITKDYKLTNIIEDQGIVYTKTDIVSDSSESSSTLTTNIYGVYNDVYDKDVILQYYTIPKNSKYIINGKYIDGSTFKKITNNTLEQNGVVGKVGYIYHDCSVFQYNGNNLDDVGFYVNKTIYIYDNDSFTQVTAQAIPCYTKDGLKAFSTNNYGYFQPLS